MKACDEEKLLGHLGVVLYEYLGEEYPEVLGSILGALKVLTARMCVAGCQAHCIGSLRHPADEALSEESFQVLGKIVALEAIGSTCWPSEGCIANVFCNEMLHAMHTLGFLSCSICISEYKVSNRFGQQLSQWSTIFLPPPLDRL